VNVYISQSSATTDLTGGVSFNSSIFRKSFLSLTLKKKLWKLVHIGRSYRKK